MSKFWIKPSFLIKSLFPNYIWTVPASTKTVYLTFDDGPIPEITEWVLDQLKSYEALATFFCIGENIQKHPMIFQKLINSDHALGNHTFNHLKGWNTSVKEYLKNALLCERILQNKNEKLFRPPYGKIKSKQSQFLRKRGYKIIMWDVLSKDYDTTITPEECLNNVISNVEPGSIIVFHDSIKAFKNLEYVLPKTLEYLKTEGYTMGKIS
jgi:peptidoglycan/xylan/chitin deacetylase (PgdA/CDA1 family)